MAANPDQSRGGESELQNTNMPKSTRGTYIFTVLWLFLSYGIFWMTSVTTCHAMEEQPTIAKVIPY